MELENQRLKHNIDIMSRDYELYETRINSHKDAIFNILSLNDRLTEVDKHRSSIYVDMNLYMDNLRKKCIRHTKYLEFLMFIFCVFYYEFYPGIVSYPLLMLCLIIY